MAEQCWSAQKPAKGRSNNFTVRMASGHWPDSGASAVEFVCVDFGFPVLTADYFPSMMMGSFTENFSVLGNQNFGRSSSSNKMSRTRAKTFWLFSA